ncbi:MAG: terminase small subunit [Gammaproteobacteria bacterium]|jgi:phage terminase small subunit|nr:terminase small subunit [Gammaproteobacteria bacterium]
MKKPDIEKEEQFVKHFIATGNATESARLSGYGKNSGQMGYYLKNKLKSEIDKGLRDVLDSLTPKSITVMESMLDSDSDNVKLATCKYILSDLNGYGHNSVNVNMNYEAIRKEEEMDRQISERLAEAFEYLTQDDISRIFAENPDTMNRIVECVKTAKLNQTH